MVRTLQCTACSRCDGGGAPPHIHTHLRRLREDHLLDAVRSVHRLWGVPRDHHQHRAIGRLHTGSEVGQVELHVVLLDDEIAHPELGVVGQTVFGEEALQSIQQFLWGRVEVGWVKSGHQFPTKACANIRTITLMLRAQLTNTSALPTSGEPSLSSTWQTERPLFCSLYTLIWYWFTERVVWLRIGILR